jgi:serine/threonine-protein kinase
VDEAAETSPTLSFAATRAGVILGTASYMSPEQARGHKADRRSDIWSFGVVLFEMLSGKRLFDGDTPSDVLAQVLTTEPDWDVLPADVPPTVRDLLRRCLTRERKSRLQAIGEARIAIEAYLADPDLARRSEPVATEKSKLPWRLVLGLLAAALLASLWIVSRSSTDVTPPMRLSVELDANGVQLVEHSVADGAMTVLSPDGSTLAFVGRTSEGGRQLYVRSLEQLRATPLGRTEGAHSPFFSPDGRWIAFFKDNALETVALTGAAAQTVAAVVN